MSAVLLAPGREDGAPVRRFAFSGRVSTEDNQDPDASRNWQISRSRALIEPAGGIIVAEYFDIGQSRSLPWKRRPRAAQLLPTSPTRIRGFDAVVIGEPQRAFYGNQYSLTMPVFTHYGVGLWVPEVGGAVDPDSEAHDLIMSVFGGMSKGERTRIKIRVRSAMSAQAAIEGRFLGGRPPYGYRIADAGPHPNPAKAADGKRLHKLEPDPETAWVVRRIFAEYLAGRGLFAIAEGLTRDADSFPVPARPGPQSAPHRRRLGQERCARHPAQPPLHRPAGLEQAAQGRDPPRRQRRRPRLRDPAALERRRAVGLVRHHRPGAPGLRGRLRGRPGHHGRRRARPAGQPRDRPAGPQPLRPARPAVLRVLRAPDARPVQPR